MRRYSMKALDHKQEYMASCGLHCIKIHDVGVKIGQNRIIDNINLHIHCGKLTAIIGRNGAGKSTLMKAILGEVPHEGYTTFRNMKTDQEEKLSIGYVPQRINIPKNTPTSVYDLFASFISNAPVFLMRRKKVYEYIQARLKIFEAEKLIDKQVCDLSGGELQRVLLSIATTPLPNLLLLDEPVSGMDNNGMKLFYKTVDQLKKNWDIAILLVSHDLEYVAQYADYVVLLDGRIQKEGTPREVYESKEFKQVFGNISFQEITNERIGDV